jgi:hypothetical protein
MSDGYTDDGGNYSEAVGTRLTPQTKRQFDEYQDENELSNSQALRRLVREGLATEGYREQRATPDGGEVMDRLDELSRQQEEMAQQQESAQQLRTVATLAGIAYIAVTVGLSMSSVLWGALGIVLVVAIAAGVYLSGGSA